jgi:hypothetical protein
MQGSKRRLMRVWREAARRGGNMDHGCRRRCSARQVSSGRQSEGAARAWAVGWPAACGRWPLARGSVAVDGPLAWWWWGIPGPAEGGKGARFHSRRTIGTSTSTPTSQWRNQNKNKRLTLKRRTSKEARWRAHQLAWVRFFCPT